MTNITLKQLKYFVAAGELKSITEASRQLHITQPSISAAILHIEQISNITLFNRHSAQGVILTPAGQEVFYRAKSLLEESEKLFNFITSISSEISGALKIAAFESFTHIIRPQIMKLFNQKYPNVNLHYEVQHQAELLDGLKRGRYDLCFGYDLDVPDNIDFIELSSHAPYVAVDKDHPLVHHKSVSFAELSIYPMILLDWPISREYFIKLFEDMGQQPTIAHYVSSIPMARSLAAQGFGYTMFNIPIDEQVLSPDEKLISIPLRDPAKELKIGMLTMADSAVNATTKALMDVILDHSSIKNTSPRHLNP